MDLRDPLTEQIISACIEVHRSLGPGLIESAYEKSLAWELELRRVPFERQKRLPLSYKGVQVGNVYRADFVVADEVVVELEASRGVHPVDLAQVRTYLRVGGFRVGLVIAWHAVTLGRGSIKRVEPSTRRR